MTSQIKPVDTGALRLPFDALCVRAIARELRPLLVGGILQEIRSPNALTLWFSIRSGGESHKLIVSLHPHFYRAHLTHRRSGNSATPSGFCNVLRARLMGSHIESVEQIGFDRILAFRFSTPDPDHPVQILQFELMGKLSNAMLLDADGRIVDAAKRAGARINRYRQILPGSTYHPPPGLCEAPPSLTGISQSELRNIKGLPPFVATMLISIAEVNSGVDLQREFDRLLGASDPIAGAGPALEGAYPIAPLWVSDLATRPRDNFSEALDTAYDLLEAREAESNERNSLSALLAREKAWLEESIRTGKRAIEEGLRAEVYRRSGEMLLANLWRAQPGGSSALVTDYYDPDQGEIEIKLNPQLSPQENAEHYFTRAASCEAHMDSARTRIASAEARLLQLTRAESILAGISTGSATAVDELTALRKRLCEGGVVREPKPAGFATPSRFAGHRIRSETTPDGYEILVGETSDANDYLTTRVASPSDIWLHVRSAPGGHVVIRTNGSPDRVPGGVLERAAVIAARHSTQKHSSLVAVDWTQKRYVRKPRGSKPGSVVIEREKTLHVSPL